MTERIQWYNADGLRYCTRCHAYMPLDSFHSNRAARTPDGRTRYCKLCWRALRRQTYERHRAREIAAATAWQQAHPERARATARRANRVYYRLRQRTPMQVVELIERAEQMEAAG
jgi:hypothetical protein